MSRIPIREALVQLESEGLRRILPHRGAQVSELSPAEIRELFELRACSSLGSCACPRLDSPPKTTRRSMRSTPNTARKSGR